MDTRAKLVVRRQPIDGRLTVDSRRRSWLQKESRVPEPLSIYLVLLTAMSIRDVNTPYVIL